MNYGLTKSGVLYQSKGFAFIVHVARPYGPWSLCGQTLVCETQRPETQRPETRGWICSQCYGTVAYKRLVAEGS